MRLLFWVLIASIFPPILAALGKLTFDIVTHYYSTQYSRRFKTRILPGLVAFLDERLTHAKGDHLSPSALRASRLPVQFSRHALYFSGTIGATNIEISESLGRGMPPAGAVMFAADFQKSFAGITVVLPDTVEQTFGRFGTKMQAVAAKCRGLQLVKLEDPEFEQYFVVYADDQIQARYIVSPTLMRRMVALRQRISSSIAFSFVGSKIFITSDSVLTPLFRPFEVDSYVRFGPIELYAEFLQSVIDIIEDLKLNSRIWKAQPAHDVDDGIMQIIKKYQALFNDPFITIHPFIPEKRLKNARKGYASRCSRIETPLLLIDDSPSQNGTSGCLISDRRLYSNKLLNHADSISLLKLADCDSYNVVLEKTLFANGRDLLRMASPSAKSMRLVAGMLRELAHYLHDSRGDADMLKILDTYRRQIHDSMVFFSPDIPEQKLNNARRRYASHYSPK